MQVPCLEMLKQPLRVGFNFTQKLGFALTTLKCLCAVSPFGSLDYLNQSRKKIYFWQLKCIECAKHSPQLWTCSAVFMKHCFSASISCLQIEADINLLKRLRREFVDNLCEVVWTFYSDRWKKSFLLIYMSINTLKFIDRFSTKSSKLFTNKIK